MGDHRRTYTAVAFPWDGAWQVVVLDPAGQVLTTSSAAGERDVERVARAVLRERLTRGPRAAELRIVATAPAC